MALTLDHENIKASVGDTVKVHITFAQGDKKKKQVFKGTLIAIRGRGSNRMFTVRKVGKDKIGVERIFPLNSPFVQNLEVVKKGKTRRSKLFFIRGLSERELRDKLS